jgi:protein-tyrosine phosphatase
MKRAVKSGPRQKKVRKQFFGRGWRIGRASGTKWNRPMDMTWVTDRIAVGGGIWSAENMAEVARMGVTHIVDMQAEFDDTALAKSHGIEVLWNATEDDFQLKPPELLRRGVEFAQAALDEAGTKVYVHCAAGVHRAPMMTLAILCSIGWSMEDAMEMVQGRRPVVDFADVYVRSVENFLEQVEAG